MQIFNEKFTGMARFGVTLFLALAAASSAAGARELDAELRQYVIASCSTDAYRLCPQALGNEAAAVNCMKANRRQLNLTCRVAYDKAAHVLKQ